MGRVERDVNVQQKVMEFVRQHGLLRPGERISAAVSGGADSVALLRVLLELRDELGIVLSVAHFNHRIRGAQSDADEQFVRELAARHALEFHSGSGDAPGHAREHKLSLETAARQLRHAWFAGLVRQGKADKIATAHTQDDQAETVLMRVLRGTGTRGLAAMTPGNDKLHLVRPLLGSTRAQVEDYLKSAGQDWREDASNRDLAHTRNRIRHELLPLLERSYNPAVKRALADLAEVAYGEEEVWEANVGEMFSRLVRAGKPVRGGGRAAQGPVLAISLGALLAQPRAMQRRLLIRMAEQMGVTLDFHHVEEVRRLAGDGKRGAALQLANGLMAVKSFRELQMEQPEGAVSASEYAYSLRIPGEVEVPELGVLLRARVVTGSPAGYNSGLLDRSHLAAQVTVRNWHPGDRFFPAHTKSPRKIKELLQPARVGRALSAEERKLWPVVEMEGEIVWVRGFAVPQALTAGAGPGVLIEEVRMGTNRE